MKILFLIDSLEVGGAERSILGLAGYFSSQGYNTEIQIYNTWSARLYSLPENVKVVWNPLLKFTRPATLIMSYYWKLFPKKKPDLIISFKWLMNYTAAYFAKKNHIPVIISERSNPNRVPGLRNLYLRFHSCIQSVSMVVALSEDAARIVAERFHLRENQTCVIHNPLHFAAVGPDNSVLPQKMPDHYLLAVGRLCPVKGYPRMLRVFAEVHKHFPDEKLVICGDGTSRKRIEKIILRLSLTDSVILAGACKNIGAYYQHADALLFTSFYEGQPNVLLEAQACGCPPIAFDCDYGPSYLIQHQKTGLVIPDGDEDGMAKAVINYLNHPEMKKEFQKNMPEHLKQFAPEKIYPQWNELIHKIIDERDNFPKQGKCNSGK